MSLEQAPASEHDPAIARERMTGRAGLSSKWSKSPSGDHVIKLLSIMTIIGLWYFAAAFLPPNVMPPPHRVVTVLWDEMVAGAIWIDVAISMSRIVLAFSVAMSIALVLGFAMGLSKTAERFFDVWIIGGLTVPSLVIILTIYMVVGLNDTAAVLAAALPVVAILTINIWEGIKNIDQKLIDMSKAYHAGPMLIIRSVVAPQIAPVIMASSRFGLGLIWKMVLFVELLGRSDGIGYKIEFNYQMFNMSAVLAHALLFLFIMLFIEIALLGRLERHLFRWRPAQRRL
ncbi:MAG: NitT/TauT family transport system permease protein [Alphaproteobacteria bacterium]|jgi:NitT/TauT family transport system permease protein|nr:NitT/TauT family transport system permease protein [Alphaproteobacteria bacterium]